MKKILSIALLAAMLGGCLPSRDDLSSASSEPQWSKYVENDGAMGDIAFYSENLAKTNALKDGDVIGTAIVKRGDTALKLGDMYALNGLSFTLLELDEGLKFGYRYINMRDKADHESLKKAKKIKFYQFGGGILQTAVYSVDSGLVCGNFAAGKAVKARVVTNYYDKDDASNTKFFTTLMDASVKKGKGAEIKNLDFKFFVDDAKLSDTQAQARSAEFKAKIIDADARKQEQILSSLICN